MRFIDEAKVYLQSGKGGNGCTAFFHCRKRRRRIPSGGNAGNGGSLYICGDSQLNTLLHLRFHPHYRAGDGEAGGPNCCAGKTGKEEIIRVPLGTRLFVLPKKQTGENNEIDSTTEPWLEILNEEPQFLLKGGKGGVGNALQAGVRSGQPGQKLNLKLELNLLANAGLIGLPNAGKSTLISVLSNARPRIADYPFTTLTPQLGLVRGEDEKSLVIADIPGILPGAHQGKGLGLQFLRHIRRSAILVFVIACEPELDAWKGYQTLQHELQCFDSNLAQKPRLVVLAKVDQIEDEVLIQSWQQQFAQQNLLALPVSSLQHKGLQALSAELFKQVERERGQQVTQAPQV